MESPDVFNRLREASDKDPSHRKLFVHGLSRETTTDTLLDAYFSYGEIEDCVVVTDNKTGKGKGYAFITFKHIDGVHRALKDTDKKIDGRKIFCRKYYSEFGPHTIGPSHSVAARKIYVSNIPTSMSADKLLEAFSKYGEVQEGPLGFDKETGKSKGYALLIYKSVDSVMKALEEPIKFIDGVQVMCKLADSKPKSIGDSQLPGLGSSASTVLSNSALLGLLPGQQSTLTAQGFLTPNASLAGLNAALYPSIGSPTSQLGFNPALRSSLGASLNPLLTQPLSASLSGSLINEGAVQGLTQASIPLRAASLYGMPGLGTQLPGLGGTSVLDSHLYGLSSIAEPGLLQGSGTHALAGLRTSLSSYLPK